MLDSHRHWGIFIEILKSGPLGGSRENSEITLQNVVPVHLLVTVVWISQIFILTQGIIRVKGRQSSILWYDMNSDV